MTASRRLHGRPLLRVRVPACRRQWHGYDRPVRLPEDPLGGSSEDDLRGATPLADPDHQLVGLDFLGQPEEVLVWFVPADELPGLDRREPAQPLEDHV